MFAVTGVALLVPVCAAQDFVPPADKVYHVCAKAAKNENECADVPPKAIYAPDPEYSDEARHNGIQGAVVMTVVIGKDGLVKNVVVEKGLGYGLDEKASNTVREWKFQPARMKSEPVAVTVNVQMKFRMYSSPQPRGFPRPRP